MPISLRKKWRRRNKKLLIVTAAFSTAAAAIYCKINFIKNKQHTYQLHGRQWMEELLNGHPARCKDNLGISREGFRYLEDLLVRKAGLLPTRYMGTTEQLGIFLYAVVLCNKGIDVRIWPSSCGSTYSRSSGLFRGHGGDD
jgi:hypothetical protein